MEVPFPEIDPNFEIEDRTSHVMVSMMLAMLPLVLVGGPCGERLLRVVVRGLITFNVLVMTSALFCVGHWRTTVFRMALSLQFTTVALFTYFWCLGFLEWVLVVALTAVYQWIGLDVVVGHIPPGQAVFGIACILSGAGPAFEELAEGNLWKAGLDGVDGSWIAYMAVDAVLFIPMIYYHAYVFGSHDEQFATCWGWGLHSALQRHGFFPCCCCRHRVVQTGVIEPVPPGNADEQSPGLTPVVPPQAIGRLADGG